MGMTCAEAEFTGKERDSESALDNFGARYYSSQYGRFMTPDPMGGDVTKPQTLNKYSYVRNNPLVLVDPTGLSASDLGSGDRFCDTGFCERVITPKNFGNNLLNAAENWSPFDFVYSGCPYGAGSCSTQKFDTWDAYANWSTWYASWPAHQAYVQLTKALPYLEGMDPNSVYTVQGQRRGFTMNYQVLNAGSALQLDTAAASAAGTADIGPGHPGPSWYIGGWVNTFHAVDVINPILPGQFAGAEFHTDAFSPYGPFLPLHAVDWAASHVLPNGQWKMFYCSVSDGCF